MGLYLLSYLWFGHSALRRGSSTMIVLRPTSPRTRNCMTAFVVDLWGWKHHGEVRDEYYSASSSQNAAHVRFCISHNSTDSDISITISLMIS